MDNIKAKLLRELCKYLVHITNLSFVSENYPDQLITAKIIPLYKKCESQFIRNYTQISLLSILNKIMEKTSLQKLLPISPKV